MNKNFTKILTATLILFALTFWHFAAHAQKVLYTNNFDGADTANVPNLPTGWSSMAANNGLDSNWYYTNLKAILAPKAGSSGKYNLYIDSKTARLNQNIDLTFAGVSTKGYKNITMFWNERFSTKYKATSHNRIRVDYSINNGKTWDSLNVNQDTTGSSVWKWTNDSVPVKLPAKAENVSNLMVRFVSYIIALGGNYNMDDFSIMGTAITTGVEVDNSSSLKLNSWCSNDMLNVQFDNSKEAEFYVYNMSGMPVIHQHINSGSTSINVSNLTSGVYITKVVTNDAIYTNKIVK